MRARAAAYFSSYRSAKPSWQTGGTPLRLSGCSFLVSAVYAPVETLDSWHRGASPCDSFLCGAPEDANKLCGLCPVHVCRNSAATSRCQCLMKKTLASTRCLHVSALACLTGSFKTSATLEGDGRSKCRRDWLVNWDWREEGRSPSSRAHFLPKQIRVYFLFDP